MSNINLELNEITKFRLNEINKLKDCFNSEIKERKDFTNKLSRYIVVFDYADKIFITLSASFGTVSNGCGHSSGDCRVFIGFCREYYRNFDAARVN